MSTYAESPAGLSEGGRFERAGGKLHGRDRKKEAGDTKDFQPEKSPPGTEPELRCNTPERRRRGGCHLSDVTVIAVKEQQLERVSKDRYCSRVALR